jgi:hypothetical protein
MKNIYKLGLKLIVDGIEYTLIENNEDRGIFQVTDKKFESWLIKPTIIFRYTDIDDCIIIK